MSLELRSSIVGLCLGLTLVITQPLTAEPDESMLRLVQDAVHPKSSRVRDDQLIALRRLRDPLLQPLFASFASSDNAALRRHGILGLGELEKPPRITPMMISRLNDPLEMASILGEAWSSDLVWIDDVQSILGWPRLDPSLELVLRSRQVSQGMPQDVQRLEQLLESGGMVNQVLASVLLAAQGKPEKLIAATDNLIALQEPARGTFTGILLPLISKERLPAASPLLARLAEVYSSDPALHADVLRVWLQIAPKDAAPHWLKAVEQASGSMSQQLRLALAALDAADTCDATMFRPLDGEPGSLLSTIAAAGRSLASGSGQAEALSALAAQRYQPTELWLADRASTFDPVLANETRRAILTAAASRKELSDGLSDGVPLAAEELAPNDPKFIRSILESASVRRDARLIQAILVGMLRGGSAPVWDATSTLTWPDRTSGSIAMLVEARHDTGFGRDQEKMSSLRTIAEGMTGRLPASMRIQAAWLYLARSGEGQTALARVLSAD